MRRATTLRLLAAASLAAFALAALPQLAGAVLSGSNGRIVFVSGRDQASDADAKLRFWRVPPSALDPAISDPLSGAAGQHRHPSWSPDRTQIAYARTGTGGMFDIFILDLTAPPGTPPTPVTSTAAVAEDRPAWSPDGTRIAWETGGAASDILIDTLPVGAPANFTPNEAEPAGKPAWSPDSATIYYNLGPIDGAGGARVVRKAANNPTGTPGLVTTPGVVDEYQPSVSPDGTRICYTRGPLNGNADVFVSAADGSQAFDLSDNLPPSQPPGAAFGDYNCTWSPDGTEIAYVRGTTTAGDLVVEPADDSQIAPQAIVDTVDRFDGNPDWAPDGRPACQPRSVTTPRDRAVAIVLSCPDTGPAYEQSPVRVDVVNPGPANGTIPLDPSAPGAGTVTLTYTPRAGFVGRDTFEYVAFDAAGFAPRVPVTIDVTAPGAGGPGGGLGVPGSARCEGKRATIVGTARGETIRGTAKRDVIAALGGNDTVRGLGGPDLICLGAGADKAFGGAGGDRILGQGGPDRILGGPGPDVMLGGAGRDVLLGGAGRNRALGGAGRDACSAALTRSC